MRFGKLTSIGLVAVALAGASAAPAGAQGQDQGTPTTANFLQMCSNAANRDGCKDLLADFLLNNNEPCVPGLDAVLAELRARSDLGSRPWTEGVDAAVKTLCARPQQ